MQKSVDAFIEFARNKPNEAGYNTENIYVIDDWR
jgi:hypothetical protein